MAVDPRFANCPFYFVGDNEEELAKSFVGRTPQTGDIIGLVCVEKSEAGVAFRWKVIGTVEN